MDCSNMNEEYASYSSILYHNFSFKLIDVEQFFYTKIYEPGEDYNEEVLSEILNSLLG